MGSVISVSAEPGKMGEVRTHVSFTHIKDQEIFLNAVKSLIDNIAKSPGCVSTGLFKELGGISFAIIETWESEAACDKDMASDHVSKFLQEMGDSVTVDVKKFSAV